MEIDAGKGDCFALPLYQAIAEGERTGYQAIGKVVQDITLTATSLPSWSFEDWGYGRNKITQLTRNYVNEEEFERVRSVLKRRSDKKYTSVAISLRGKPKDSRSQGWCMLSAVISRNGPWSSIEVQYRTTEAILKFAADIIFLKDYILRWVDLTPHVFRFRFANCALSGAYFPYLVDKIDLVHFLKQVRAFDEEFFLRTTRFLLKSSYRQDQYHPFSPERVSHKFLWQRASRKQIDAIRAYLEPLHKATGRPLPKDFHDESYIPKGQRARQVEESEDE